MLLWLQDKVGYFLGLVIFYFLAKVGNSIFRELKIFYFDWKMKQDQAEKQKKLEEDVQLEKPRNEETRKNEEDWLNS